MTSMATKTRPPEIGSDGTITSWLPMSTAWPSVSGCESQMFKFVPQILAGWDPGYELFVPGAATCLPPQMLTWWDADKLTLGIDTTKTKLSVGPIVCPEAYTTATTITNAGKSTFVACCPSSYSFQSVYAVGDTGQCVSRLRVGKPVVYMTRNSLSSWVETTSTVEATSSWVIGIQLNGWLFPDSTATPSSTFATQTATTTADPTSSAAGSDTPSSAADSGLSTGAKAGIGIGVGLGAVAILAVVGALMFRRRKRKMESPPEYGAVENKDAPVAPSEMYASVPKNRTAVAELPEGGSRPVELP